jgi:hypothetical protein
MTFEDVLMECAGTPEFVREFNRLTGFALDEARTPIDRMVDEATGRERAALGAFTMFVYECVWLTLPTPTEETQ